MELHYTRNTRIEILDDLGCGYIKSHTGLKVSSAGWYTQFNTTLQTSECQEGPVSTCRQEEYIGNSTTNLYVLVQRTEVWF